MGGPLWGVIRKSTVNKGKQICYADLLCRFKWVPSPLVRFSCDLELYFSSWCREGDTLTNGDFLYKCQFLLQKGNFPTSSTLFSELLQCLLFLKNNWLIVIIMPKRYILGWNILLPFICLFLISLTNICKAPIICQALFKLLHKQ